jgi:hypothetical protein
MVSNQGKMNYFAYGSNMWTPRLRARVPSCRFNTIARLLRHRLCFHKKSVDGSSKCDAFETGSERDAVWGVVFDILPSEKQALDKAEGLGNGPVSCNPINLDRYGRTVATCSVGGADLGEWLVRNGLAVDWPQYSHGRYDAVQREAEQAGRGMWKGSYVEPWLYRVCVRAGGKLADCSDDANAHP